MVSENLQRHPKIEVMELSELYSNKGTSKYYRAYAEIEKSNVNKKIVEFFSLAQDE